MKIVKVYEYAVCSTCKRALAFLSTHQRAVERIDIFTTPPSKAELKRMVAHYEGNFKKLFNTAGRIYQERQLAPKVAKMSESEAIDLLASDGRLIKRPFVLTENSGLVGFDPVAWKKVFA